MAHRKHLELSKTSCSTCHKALKYLAGTDTLACHHCGAKTEIPPASQKSVDELDYFTFLENAEAASENIILQTVKCNHCHASSSIDTSRSTNACPHCGDELVVTNATSDNLIKPWGIIPFKVSETAAKTSLQQWFNKRWFKHAEITKDLSQLSHLKSVYIPFWTFDTHALIQYYGKRGEESGGEEAQVLWFEETNELTHFFDDILISATHAVPEELINSLRPWGTADLIPFDERYLAGHTTEKYQVDLKTGFNKAQERTTEAIGAIIRADIGGDHQQILSVRTSFTDITFKHILLPIYMASYQVKGMTYQFVINAKTGEVQGKIPRSLTKIILFVLTATAIVSTTLALLI